MTRKMLIIFLLSIGLMIQMWALNKKLPSTEDFVDFRELLDVRISPDGKQVAFVVTQKSNSDIWLVPSDGKEPARPFAVSVYSEISPRWSPDGRYLAFLSNCGRDNKKQIYLLKIDGGEARQITQTDGDIRVFKWSRNGNMIAFTSRDSLTAEEIEKKGKGDDVIHVDRNPKYTRLWVQSLGTLRTKRVTQEDWDVKDFAWSSDDSKLAIFVDGKLVIVCRETGEVVRTLSTNVASPQTRRKIFDWSPDGQKILFAELSPAKVGSWMTIVSAKGGDMRPLLKNYHGTISKAIWGPKSKYIFAQSFECTASKLIRINAKTGDITCLVDEIFRVKPDFSISADSRKVAYLNSSVTNPPEVWVYNKGSGKQRLTQLHQQMAPFRFGKVKEISWKNKADDLVLYGVIVMPVDYESGRSYPMVTQIHGGPHIAWARGWLGDWHDWAQLLAVNGYVVFLPNPRGSMGQGLKFSEANVGDLGGGDFRDIMSGVDYLVNEGIADPERLGIGGWSYGGYMTARTVTKTKRFKAAVVGAGITDVVSHVLSGQHGLYWTKTYCIDVPARRPDIYKKVSPINYLQNVVTPTLILHGEKDPKISVRQGYEFYFGLKMLNIETEMVVYPRQGHSIREPTHQLDFMRRILAWFNKYLSAFPCKQTGSISKKISKEDKKVLLEYLTSNHQSPEDYIVSLFKNHDIVFVGESHFVKNYLEFLHSLIPALYKNCIYNLGYEFSCYVDQEDIDRLVFGDKYDEKLAREITIKHNVLKGYKEFVDVFKVAWHLNHSLPQGAQKFRIIGLDTPRDVSVMKSEDDYNDIKTRRRLISDGIHRHDHRNDYWAVVIGREPLNHNKKALIYCGTGYSSVKFRVDHSSTTPHFTSAGNKIYNVLGDRVAEVVLKCEYSELISDLISTLPPKYQRGGN